MVHRRDAEARRNQRKHRLRGSGGLIIVGKMDREEAEIAEQA
jgi:hypothetical protein